MSGYPTFETIPPAIYERVAFAVGMSLSLLVIGAYGWQAIVHELPTQKVLLTIVLGLLLGAPFSILGFLLRKRRLRRIAVRNTFLAGL